MLTVEAASRQIQKKVFLCFQYEIVNFILFFCPPHQTIFPITYRRQRILDFSNWFQSHYMSFFLFFLFGILIVELIFFQDRTFVYELQRWKNWLPRFLTFHTKKICDIGSLSNENTNLTFFFLFSSFIFHKSKMWKKVFKVVVSKYTFFFFDWGGSCAD